MAPYYIGILELFSAEKAEGRHGLKWTKNTPRESVRNGATKKSTNRNLLKAFVNV